MKHIIIVLFLLGVILLTCTDKSTNPVNEEPKSEPVDSLFTIKYDVTGSMPVTKEILADSGGSMTAIDPHGVTFTLTIPPHSLASNTNITLRPLTSFDINGPITILPTDTVNGFTGIICEPADLVLDSGATFTVNFPSGQQTPFDSGTVISYFDTDGSIFYPVSTEIDVAKGSLSCNIHHFSGYTTLYIPPEQDECEVMESMFWSQRDYFYSTCGSDNFRYAIIRLLEMRSGNYRSDPYGSGQGWLACPSFNLFVDSELRLLVERHITAIKEFCETTPVTELNFNYIIDLHRDLQNLVYLVYDTDARSTFIQARDQLHLYISDKARALVTIGYDMCKNDNCDGKAYLERVLYLGYEGYVVTSDLIKDETYLQQVSGWIDDCCAGDLIVTLSIPGSSEIKRIALDLEDVYANPDEYICTLKVKVTGESGLPKQASVQFWNATENVKISHHSTDDNGEVNFFVKPSQIDFECQEFKDLEFYVIALDKTTEEWTEPSNHVNVRFNNVLITTTIDYAFNYNWSGGEASLICNVTLNGSGTAPGASTLPGGRINDCSSTCDGLLLRNYSCEQVTFNTVDSSYVSSTLSTIGNESTYACRSEVSVHSVTVDGETIKFLYGASISLNSLIFNGMIIQDFSGQTDTLNNGIKMAIFPEYPLEFFFPHGSLEVDTVWTYSLPQDPPNAYGDRTANLSVKISVQN